jgi:hypothetical protein
MNGNKMQRRMRTSGALVFLGLVIELISLVWSHPTAFVLFLVPGALLMAAGILLYLYSLVSVPGAMAERNESNGESPSSSNSIPIISH